MNLAEIARTLVRRWYVTVPLLLVTVALAVGSFLTVKPTYERVASLVLLPDSASIPVGGNPYLFLSGLNNVTDVLIRAAAAPEFLEAIKDRYPGSTVEIIRDPTTASPVLAITASAATDDAAASIVDQAVVHVTDTLLEMQTDEGLTEQQQISVRTLSVDQTGTLVQKQRVTAAALVGAAGLLITLVVPMLVQGLSTRRRRRPEGYVAPTAADVRSPSDDDDDDSDVEVRDELTVDTSTGPTKRIAKKQGKVTGASLPRD